MLQNQFENTQMADEVILLIWKEHRVGFLQPSGCILLVSSSHCLEISSAKSISMYITSTLALPTPWHKSLKLHIDHASRDVNSKLNDDKNWNNWRYWGSTQKLLDKLVWYHVGFLQSHKLKLRGSGPMIYIQAHMNKRNLKFLSYVWSEWDAH